MDPNIGMHTYQPLVLMFSSIFLLGMLTLAFIPHWFIFKKAGFNPWLSVLMFVPLVNFFMLYYLAFARWKVVPANMVYPAAPPVAYQPPQK